MTDKISDKVFASAEEVLGHGGEKVPILGHLIWYSVKESRIKIEEMRKLFAQIGLSADFLPEEPSNINAYKRATTELSEEVEVKLDQNRTAVYLVRLTAKSDEEIVKSIIKEVRDAGDKRLSYEKIGRVHFDKDTEDVSAPSKARSRQLVKIQHEERVSRHLRTEPHTQSGNRLM